VVCPLLLLAENRGLSPITRKTVVCPLLLLVCPLLLCPLLLAARTAAVAIGHKVEILGVVPASLARRANHVRAQLLIQADTRRELQQFLRAWRPALDSLQNAKLRCSLDVDPLEF